MQTLLFEVQPKDGHEDHYFNRVAILKPLLEKHDGLLFIDRFKSLVRPGLILSHSHWRDEAALARWRSDGTHYKSQDAGRNKHFADYRIRISQVLTQTRADGDLEHFDANGGYLNTDDGARRIHLIVASNNKPVSLGGESFQSVNFENSFLHLVDCASKENGQSFSTQVLEDPAVKSVMLCSISRDYGMFSRDEAPQYFPDIERDTAKN